MIPKGNTFEKILPMATFFITGATGTVGQHVVRSLLSDEHTVIAATRHPEDSKEQIPTARSVHFDYGDPGTFEQALTTDGIFLLGPPMVPQLFDLLSPFVDRLIEADYAGRVVYLSAYGMDALEVLPYHARMEEKLSHSKLDWNVVRPGFFAQNFGNYERENIEERGIVFAPAGDGKTPFVSTWDVGRCVAALLTDPGRSGETHILTGPEAYSYADVADLLTEITGKQIVYPQPDVATYREALRQGGAPDSVADYMIPVYGLLRDHAVTEPTDAVATLTGSRPEPLRDVLQRDFSSH